MYNGLLKKLGFTGLLAMDETLEAVVQSLIMLARSDGSIHLIGCLIFVKSFS